MSLSGVGGVVGWVLRVYTAFCSGFCLVMAYPDVFYSVRTYFFSYSGCDFIWSVGGCIPCYLYGTYMDGLTLSYKKGEIGMPSCSGLF